MSHIDDETIEKIADIAKITILEKEKIKFRKSVEDILTFVETLQSINVEGIEPFLSPLSTPWFLFVEKDKAAESVHIIEDDQPACNPPLSLQDVFVNAPEQQGDFFVVPKVIS